MKKLKKALSLTLAFALSLALAVPAFAVELKTGDNGYGTEGFELNVTADSVGAVTTYKYQPNADSDFVAEVPVYDIKAYEVVKFTGTAGWMFLLSCAHVTAADGALTPIDDWRSISSEGAEDEYIWYMFDSENTEGTMSLFAIRPEALAGVKYVGLRLNNQAAAPTEPEKPAEPAPEQPAEPAPEKPAEPAPEQPAEPAPEQPAEPAPEQPAEPAPEQPAEPAPEKPAEPAPEQPAEPAPEQPAEPAPEQPAEPAPEQPATPAEAGSYTAKKGDTWSSICTNFYGTNAQRYALQKANKGVKLKEGAVIVLPEKLGKAALIPAPVAGEGEKLYTVKAGDTLGKIAAAEYGNVSEYKAVFERNADRLKSANTIYEGQVIVLPVKK